MRCRAANLPLWRCLTTRPRVGFCSADVVVEQFVLGYYGGSALESLACGTPVIMRLEAEQYAGLLMGDIPPLLQASTAEDVTGRVHELATSAAKPRTWASARGNGSSAIMRRAPGWVR